MDFFQLTTQYYSNWLGTDQALLEGKGIKFIESMERDQKQIGYPCLFDIFIYRTDELMIVSYSTRIRQEVSEIKYHISNEMEIYK